jgi:Domain of unknown function (DUF4190)/GYF domain 2
LLPGARPLTLNNVDSIFSRAMEYYYTDLNGQTKGPASVDQLRALVTTGAIGANCMVVAVGSKDWVPLSTVVPIVVAGGGRTEGLSIWSFVLSLVGLFCCGFFAGIPAIICGHIALSRLKAQPYLGGHGLAVAGLIIGYLATFGWIIYLFFLGGIAALQSASQGH